MAKRKELTFQNFIELDGAEPVPLDSLSEEKRAAVQEIWRSRLSETMSRYFSNHMDEYAKL